MVELSASTWLVQEPQDGNCGNLSSRVYILCLVGTPSIHTIWIARFVLIKHQLYIYMQ